MSWNVRRDVFVFAFAAFACPGAPAHAQTNPSHPQIDSQLLRIVKGEGRRAKVLGKRVFFGDYDGDGQRDALAFVYYDDGEGGNSAYLKVAVFHGEKGGFRFVKIANDVFGQEPRNARFGQGAIEITTTTTGPNDPRCCPTLVKRYVIRAD